MSGLYRDPEANIAAYEVSMLNMKQTMKSSRGQATMSDEDMKLALVDVMQMLDHQVEINKVLVKRIEELENKPKIKIPFR